jgi:hypothetical protein
MLQIGSGLLGKMEQLLGIPPELGGGSMSSGASPEQAGLDQHALKDARSLRPSLPARFVALIWEDEAGITSKIGSDILPTMSCRYLRLVKPSLLILSDTPEPIGFRKTRRKTSYLDD